MARILACIIIGLLLLIVSPSAAFFHTDGPEIVDSEGTPVLLRGYGLGGWLVPEGYMLHTPGYGSPTDIRNKIIGVVGEVNADQFYEAYTANYVNEDDLALIAEWGFNSIRLPFHYQNFYDPVSGTFDEAGFDLLDEFLDWCETHDLWVILDMHCAPGGQNDGNISDSDGTARLWTESATYWPMTIAIWTEIAMRYATNQRIIAYDLINEPVLPAPFTNLDLRELYIQLTNAIRPVDPNHILFMEGNWYATDFAQLTPPWDDNMAYSFHKYWNATDVGTIQYLLTIRHQNNVPLWLGETGENSNPWFYETKELMEANNIGWCWWAHKKLDTITSPLSAPINPGFQDLLDYWAGSGPQPSVAAAFNGLMQMAENLLIENCDTRPGIIRALMDPTYGQAASPFTSLTIPGIINAVHYDHGMHGLGYIDSDIMNTQGNGGAAWNSGWAYRNDGVDIEASSDPAGFAYNVGWTTTAERLMYTVEVLESGTYDLSLRVASNGGGGGLMFFLDDAQLIPTVSIPNTNGWQNWQTVIVENIYIPAGQHRLMLIVAPGGFNLNRMTFILVSTGLEDEPPQAMTHRLFQNYPNPFVESSAIRFQLAVPQRVNLTIFNSAGQAVKSLVNSPLSPGQHEVLWDGHNDSGQVVGSGMYFYRIDTEDGQTETKSMLLLK